MDKMCDFAPVCSVREEKILVEMYPSLYLSYLKCLGVIWDSPIHLARRPIVLRRWMIAVNYIICLCIRDWTFLSVFRPTSVCGCPRSKVDVFEFHHRYPNFCPKTLKKCCFFFLLEENLTFSDRKSELFSCFSF